MRRILLIVTLIWLASCGPPERATIEPDGGIGGTGAPAID
jgi:hypothetical protein